LARVLAAMLLGNFSQKSNLTKVEAQSAATVVDAQRQLFGKFPFLRNPAAKTAKLARQRKRYDGYLPSYLFRFREGLSCRCLPQLSHWLFQELQAPNHFAIKM